MLTFTLKLGEAPFIGTIDGLLGVLTEQLRVSFTSKDFSVRKNKECKYLINVLLKIFQRPKVKKHDTNEAWLLSFT